MKPKKLYRTTIVIWSEYPTDIMEIDHLARDCMDGESFCESSDCEEVTNPSNFPATEFFDLPEK